MGKGPEETFNFFFPKKTHTNSQEKKKSQTHRNTENSGYQRLRLEEMGNVGQGV